RYVIERATTRTQTHFIRQVFVNTLWQRGETQFFFSSARSRAGKAVAFLLLFGCVNALPGQYWMHLRALLRQLGALSVQHWHCLCCLAVLFETKRERWEW